MAVAEINHTGNLVNNFKIKLNTYGKTTEQSKALVGDAIKALMNYAVLKQKPIIIENLDFQSKKRELKKLSSKRARLLSSFNYSLIIKMLHSKAFRSGVEVFKVNPAYSSIIGRVKYARMNTISVHIAAALVIARRFYRYSERLPRNWAKIPDNTGGHVTLPKLVKILDKHVWHSWAKVKKNLQAALAVQYQKFRKVNKSPLLTRFIIEDIPF